MIISKDLFIFGEQIFATIIPENGSNVIQQPANISSGATNGAQLHPTTATTADTKPSTEARDKDLHIIQLVEEEQKNCIAEPEQIRSPVKTVATATAATTATTTTRTTTLQSIKPMNLVSVEGKERSSTVVAVCSASRFDLSDTETTTTDEQPLFKRNLVKATTQSISTAAVAAAAAAPVAVPAAVTPTRSYSEFVSIATLPPVKQEVQEKSQPQQQHRRQFEPETLVIVPDTILTTTAATAAVKTITTQTPAFSSTSSRVFSSSTSQTATTKDAAAETTTTTNSLNYCNNKMEKSILPSKTKSVINSDNTTVSFPFIVPEQHYTLQLSFQNLKISHNERRILTDVSGSVSPGEVLAVMGPSGSGKTTLLDALSGQRRVDSGNIYLNCQPLSKKWRRKIGYVLQEEIFFTQLTLRETVMYTALLRLPDSMPKSEKIREVDRIIEALELTFCQHTKIGDYLNRGLSGGEKKRANIACELLTNPLLMLLDEPTSGLDSHSALSLMKVLKRYAKQEQKTIVITVHQPSSQLFHMFDKLLLLHNGRTAYFGEVNNIYRYFEDIGVAIKPHYNPADFVLEQLKSHPDIREKLFVAAKESVGNFLNRNCLTIRQHGMHQNGGHKIDKYNHNHLNHHNHHHHEYSEPNGAKAHTESILINDIIDHYYKDHHHHHHHDRKTLACDEEDVAERLVWCGADSQSTFSSCGSSDCQSYHGDCGTNTAAGGNADCLDYPTHFNTQFCVLSSRNFKEAKPRMLSKLNWVQTIGLALMAGAIWFQLPRTEEFLHDLQGWMFFSQTYWMLFALFGALNSFPSEREVISKERRAGAYRLSAYYLAKMFGELPLVVTLPTIYLIISYPLLGCASLKLFLLMLVFLLLNTLVAQSVGFFIGAYCMDMNVSITISALYTLATQLFGGYLSSRIPEGLSWIRFTSMIHYAYQNMQILEFSEGSPIRCGNPSSYEICKNNSTTFIPYEDILKAQNSSPLWLNTLILIMFFMVFRGLGYAVLRYVRCPKT